MLARRPSSLGFPSDVAQSFYYPGEARMNREEITRVSEILEENAIYAENTRIRKVVVDGTPRFEYCKVNRERRYSSGLRGSVSGSPVLLVRGDHSKELTKINEYLGEACKYAANDHQRDSSSSTMELQSGSIETHKTLNGYG
jgi:dipeptidyl-peptidase-3